MHQWNELKFHIRHLTIEEQNRVEKAYWMGSKAHEGQKRQSGEDYFTHPIAVAHLLADMQADCDTIVASLLHDTVEDTNLTLEIIREEFGPVVAILINGVTKLSEHDFEGKPSMNEQIETLRKMFTLMQTDVRIMVIKLIDRLHNMQTISFRSAEKQKSVALETLDVYVKIADRLCMRDVRDELQGICLSVLEPGLLPHLLDIRKCNQERSNTIVPYMEDKTQKAFGHLPFAIKHELKSWDSLKRQHMIESQGRAGLITINLSFICDTIQDCYETLGILHQLWIAEAQSLEDYINAPIINGYKGLHTTVILEGGARVRCKIRTTTMNEYSHRGVTLYCFDKKAKGIMEYMPWINRISPLSKDTEQRSEEFWQSLQNDILGESILIHGEGDQAQLLPAQATALDGVFYLYGEHGLNVKNIYVDGRIVPFYEELKYAQTVHATFSQSPAVELKWLQYTHTGMGTALIRSALSKQDSSIKRATGQELLQDHMSRHRRGFISEFDRMHIERTLQDQHYPCLDDLYEQIAEGRISVQEVENIIFRNQKQNKVSAIMEKVSYVCTLNVPTANQNAVRDVLQYYTVTGMKALDVGPMEGLYRLYLLLSEEEVRTFSFTMDHIIPGKYTIRPRSAYLKTCISVAALFLLWGIDPVAAHLLLNQQGVSPIDLTLMRFLTLAAISGLFLVWIRRRQPLPEARLSLRNASLWLSVISLFCVSLATYYSLIDTLPSHYTIPMTTAGLFLTTIVNYKRVWMLSIAWGIVVLGISIIVLFTPNWNVHSMVLTALAILAFTIFSLVSERYKRKEQVSLRAAQYFFMLSALCTLFSVFLVPFVTLHDITPSNLLLIILFSIFISGLPYYIYYYLLSHKEIDFVLRYSFLIIPATLFGDILFVGIPTVATYVAAVLVAAGAFLPASHLKKYWSKYNPF